MGAAVSCKKPEPTTQISRASGMAAAGAAGDSGLACMEGLRSQPQFNRIFGWGN